MFARALEIVKKYDGIIVGSYAIRGLIPDFPVGDNIDIVLCQLPKDIDEFCSGESSNFLRDDFGLFVSNGIKIFRYYGESDDVVNSWRSLTDFDITECHYDANGVFHSTLNARRAAMARSIHATIACIDRVHKFKSYGFTVTHDRTSTHCKYLPELRDQLIANASIRDIFVDDKVIVNNEYEVFKGRCLHFRNCKIFGEFSCGSVFDNCTFTNVTLSSNSVFLVNCVGAVKVLDTCVIRECIKSPYLLVEANNRPVLQSALSYIVLGSVRLTGPLDMDEECERMFLYIDLLNTFDLPPKCLVDVLCMLMCTTSSKPNYARARQYAPKVLNLMSKSKHFAWCPAALMFTFINTLDPSEYRSIVPIEWIRDFSMLLTLTVRGCVRSKYQYYTNFLYAEISNVTVRYLKNHSRNPRIFTNHIPSFAAAIRKKYRDRFVGAVFRPCHKYSVYVVLNIDLDGIGDLIDRDGYTPDTLEFLREQLAIDHMHNGALRAYLLSRGDVPIELM